MNSFFLKTFGCKLNQTDTAGIRASLQNLGLEETAVPEHADLIVVNTCTVTHRADHEARRTIRQLKQFSPDSRLVVTGCYAERQAEVLASMPEVDAVFGLSQRKEFFHFASGMILNDPDFGGFDDDAQFGSKTRAFLKVQEGCDKKCTFCIVRLLRGKSRSLPADEVIRRLRILANRGYEEVVLTGVHIGLWGNDLGIKGIGRGILELLRRIDAEKGMPVIRLNSLEPRAVRDETLELMAGSDRFAQHLHFSVQSGSEKILRAMKRHTDVERISGVVGKARELMPYCGIGADIIVGFPGETDDDFRMSHDLLTKAPFTYAHVFSFSSRPGTEAAELPEKVHPETVTERSATLRTAMKERNLEFRSSLIGVELPAIVLHQSDSQGRPIAITGNYLHVALDGDGNPRAGRACRLTITNVDIDSTTGTPALEQPNN